MESWEIDGNAEREDEVTRNKHVCHHLNVNVPPFWTFTLCHPYISKSYSALLGDKGTILECQNTDLGTREYALHLWALS